MSDRQDKAAIDMHGLCVRRLRTPPCLALRVLAADIDHAVTALRPLGLDLPVEAMRFSPGPLRPMWVGPGEWLLVGEDSFPPDQGPLRDALMGVPHLLTDVTDGLEQLHIAGVHARDLLAKGCSLNLDPRVFGPERCTRTLLARVPVVLWVPMGPSSQFGLFIDRSLGAYLMDWLAEAAVEFDDSHRAAVTAIPGHHLGDGN